MSPVESRAQFASRLVAAREGGCRVGHGVEPALSRNDCRLVRRAIAQSARYELPRVQQSSDGNVSRYHNARRRAGGASGSRLLPQEFLFETPNLDRERIGA